MESNNDDGKVVDIRKITSRHQTNESTLNKKIDDELDKRCGPNSINCPNCNQATAKSASACPNCNYPVHAKIKQLEYSANWRKGKPKTSCPLAVVVSMVGFIWAYKTNSFFFYQFKFIPFWPLGIDSGMSFFELILFIIVVQAMIRLAQLTYWKEKGLIERIEFW